MGCPDANQVARFLGGDEALPPELEDHIDSCADCRVVVTELARTLPASIAPTEVSDAGEDLHDARWELQSGAELVARGTQIDRYVVLDAIGAGAMGVVYRAYDPELDRDVALKLVRVFGDQAHRERARQRLSREAKAMARLAHPNVVPVFDVSIVGANVFVAMELVEGVDLETHLARSPRRWREITALFVAAGRGLAAAHAADIVHRDFKPTNVLVGNDGRVRVTDFGLATDAQTTDTAGVDDDDDRSEPHAIGSSRATQRGTVAGTPAYMAPEVRDGAPADARSDQYSFAIALCEGLTGERARLPSRLPAPLRKLIARAAAPTPAARFSTMTELVVALEDALRRRTRRVVLLAALGLAGVATITGYQLARHDNTDVTCTAPDAPFAGVWDPMRRMATHARFLSSRHPLAERQWQRAAAPLDRFVAAWPISYVDACRATHVRREQSVALLERRQACLAAERARVVAIADLFATADVAIVGRAPGIADIDGRIRRCDDVTALRDVPPLPSDPVLRTLAVGAANELARAEATSLHAKFEDAVAQATTVITLARTLGDVRLEADATRSRGETEWRAGRLDDAARSLHAAVDLAKRANSRDIESGALLVLVAVLYEQAQFGEALQIARLAESTIAAIGDDERLGKLLGNRAAIHYSQGDLDAAKRDYEQALALLTKVNGPDDRTVGQTLHNLAMLEAETDPAGSLPLYERAKTVLEHALDARHPEVALLLANRAIALANIHRYDDAIRDLERSLALRRAVLPPSHRDILATQSMIAQVNAERGNHAAAIAQFRQLLASDALPADHPDRATLASGLGRSLLATGDAAGARAPLEQALAIWDAKHVSTGAVGEARFALARLLFTRDPAQRRRALDLARRAYTELATDPDQQKQVTTWLEGKRS